MSASGNAATTPVIENPTVAWPTLALFAFSLGLELTSTVLGIQGRFPLWLSVGLNSLCAYWLFTVLHDASHRAVSRQEGLNDWLGRLSIPALLPLPIFKAFRFIHMQHHRFANEHAGKDPDAYTSEGPRWLLPLRWATLDLKYVVFYMGKFSSRPVAERRESLIALVLGVAVIGGLMGAGFGRQLLFYWFIPSRIAIFWLALAFDFLPHHPKKTTQRENPWQATNNRVGLEWLMTPIFVYQNYHLVHHLYPRVPFYRYLRLWRADKAEFLRHDPLLVDIRGRELPAQAGS